MKTNKWELNEEHEYSADRSFADVEFFRHGIRSYLRSQLYPHKDKPAMEQRVMLGAAMYAMTSILAEGLANLDDERVTNALISCLKVFIQDIKENMKNV